MYSTAEGPSRLCSRALQVDTVYSFRWTSHTKRSYLGEFPWTFDGVAAGRRICARAQSKHSEALFMLFPAPHVTLQSFCIDDMARRSLPYLHDFENSALLLCTDHGNRPALHDSHWPR